MADTLLDTPVVEKGIRYVNFFNGRLLSAQDLEHERDATRKHQETLGRGAGCGVIEGLQVIPMKGGRAPMLRVTKGVAVNRQGQVLSVPEDVDIELRTQKTTAAAARPRDDAGLFGECEALVPQVIAEGTGLYVLLVGPSSALREHAPKVGLRDDGVAARCDFAWAVEGVQFTVQPLEPRGMDSVSDETRQRIARLSEATDTDAVSFLRDLVAHAFLGTEALTAHYADLMRRTNHESPMTSYGEMDALWRDFPRLGCDVPLAIVLWTGAEVLFVDLWAVRRRLASRPLSRTWPVPTSERRITEGEATFFHFQEQLAWVMQRVERGLDAIEARHFFRYLPPAGVLPLGTVRDVSKLAFFAGCTLRRPVFIAESGVEALLRESLAYPPIDLVAEDDRGNLRPELVWLYQVRENERSTTSAERFLVFATGRMPFAGHARLDVSWWNFSNYSSVNLGAPRA